MAELPISSPYRSNPDGPVTEGERNQLSSRLNAAFEGGTLDTDDYRRRLDELFAAQRLGELVPVVEGLPPLQTYAQPNLVGPPSGAPGELTPAGDGRPLLLVAGVAVAAIVLVLLIVLLIGLSTG